MTGESGDKVLFVLSALLVAGIAGARAGAVVGRGIAGRLGVLAVADSVVPLASLSVFVAGVAGPGSRAVVRGRVPGGLGILPVADSVVSFPIARRLRGTMALAAVL